MYGLVVNNAIEVGPRTWNYYIFLEYLEDESLPTTQLPRSAPSSAVITDDWNILPVQGITYPENFNSNYEELVGPFWTIHSDHITGMYNKTSRNIDHIKGDLKNVVAANRYAAEVGTLEFTFADGQVVQLYTEREERMIYLNTLLVLPDELTTPFKFKNDVFRASVTKAELQQIVFLGMNHIRSAFEWEQTKAVEIDGTTTVEQLQLIELRHPSQIE
jgi:hypothetical protein